MQFLAVAALPVVAATSGAVPTLDCWATSWQEVQFCPAVPTSAPALEPCPGGAAITDAGVCGHERCCWVVSEGDGTGSCVALLSAPADATQEVLDSLIAFGGDQTAAVAANGIGGLTVSGTGDMLSVGGLSLTPIFQGGGDFPTNLRVDGRPPVLERQRWRPHEALRRGTVGGGAGRLSVETSVRMPFGEPAVLFRLTLLAAANQTGERAVDVAMDLAPMVRWYDAFGWEWGHPAPAAADAANFARMEKADRAARDAPNPAMEDSMMG